MNTMMLTLFQTFDIENRHAIRPRFFATALVDEYYKVWHVWVTAVCDKGTGQTYIADIRLGPNGYRSTAPPGQISLPKVHSIFLPKML